MLERLLEQRKAVTLSLSQSTGNNVPQNLTANEWSTAADLVTVLRPFLDVTVLMSADRYPTLFMILPVLDGLRDYLEHTEGGLDGFRKLLIEQLGVRFGDVFGDQELTVATPVDPRFKAVLYTDEQRSKIVNWTVAMMTLPTTRHHFCRHRLPSSRLRRRNPPSSQNWNG